MVERTLAVYEIARQRQTIDRPRTVTIVLTGDVHQWIDSADRAYATETECELALHQARVAGRHGLKLTLFVTGRAVIEDPASLEALSPRRTSRSAGTVGTRSGPTGSTGR